MKFSQISKLISRLRFVNINYGSLFGTFLDGLGESFDSQNTSNKAKNDNSEELTPEEQEALEKKQKAYAARREYVDLLKNGSKSKMDKYTVDYFLIGKLIKNWRSKLVATRKNRYIREKVRAEQALEELEIQEARILVSETVPTVKASGDESIDWLQLLHESKYYVYLLSWIIKLYF